MKILNNLLLALSSALLVTGCCCKDSPTCYSPGPIFRPCCPEPCLDDEDCCDDSGYCARPYLWEHY